jgi:hypothetical protein
MKKCPYKYKYSVLQFVTKMLLKGMVYDKE